MAIPINPLENIDRFISQIDDADCLDEVRASLEFQMKRLGFDKFCYWLIWPPFGPRISFVLGNYPEKWLKYYTSKNFRSDDIVGRYASLCTRPFSWQEAYKNYTLTSSQKKVIEGGIDAGLKSGASVPIHGPGPAVATFSVSNDMDQKELDKAFILHRHEIHLIATYAHEKIISLRFGAPEISDLKLTAREIEVVTWTARGKTGWETAQILNISEDTVKQHIENSCHKLDASNKSHVVAKALQYGLICL